MLWFSLLSFTLLLSVFILGSRYFGKQVELTACQLLWKSNFDILTVITSKCPQKKLVMFVFIGIAYIHLMMNDIFAFDHFP